jgi:hypothetical protein
MIVQLYDHDWFWAFMVLGFFVQFASPIKERKAVRKQKSKRRNSTRNLAVQRTKKTPVKKAKIKKGPKAVSLSPEQQIRVDRYFWGRDGIGKFDFSVSNIPI